MNVDVWVCIHSWSHGSISKCSIWSGPCLPPLAKAMMVDEAGYHPESETKLAGLPHLWACLTLDGSLLRPLLSFFCTAKERGRFAKVKVPPTTALPHSTSGYLWSSQLALNIVRVGVKHQLWRPLPLAIIYIFINIAVPSICIPLWLWCLLVHSSASIWYAKLDPTSNISEFVHVWFFSIFHLALCFPLTRHHQQCHLSSLCKNGSAFWRLGDQAWEKWAWGSDVQLLIAFFPTKTTMFHIEIFPRLIHSSFQLENTNQDQW